MADPIGTDAEGFEVLTAAVEEMLNAYPGLSGDSIPFEELSDYGITFSASSGALIMTERRSITDYVRQACRFPFFVVCRGSGDKIRTQSFLESLGKWLCGEPTPYEPPAYPVLTGGRKITRITRENSYGLEPSGDGTQDWLLPVQIDYTNEFQL